MGSTVQYCTVLYSTVQYCTVLYSTVQYCTALYSTVQHCTVLYSTVQYCTVPRVPRGPPGYPGVPWGRGGGHMDMLDRNAVVRFYQKTDFEVKKQIENFRFFYKKCNLLINRHLL